MSVARGHGSPIEILADWEGPAVHHPGVLFEERLAADPSVAHDAAAIAGWIAVTALGGVGHPAYDAINAKVLGFLRDCRARFGPAKIDEVKKELVLEMQKYRKYRKITDAELQERIDLLFFEMDA